jgi:hypothetical protein
MDVAAHLRAACSRSSHFATALNVINLFIHNRLMMATAVAAAGELSREMAGF